MKKLTVVLLLTAFGVFFPTAVFAKKKSHVLETERPQIETWTLSNQHQYRLQADSKNPFKNVARLFVSIGSLAMFSNGEFNGKVITHRWYFHPQTGQRAFVIVFGNDELNAVYTWRVGEYHWHVSVRDQLRDIRRVGEGYQLALRLVSASDEVRGVSVILNDGTGVWGGFVLFANPIQIPRGQREPYFHTGRYRLDSNVHYLTPSKATCQYIPHEYISHIDMENSLACGIWR